MKNLIYFLILAPYILQGQENCHGSFTEYYLNSNNIRASFFPRGNRFTSGNNGAFLAPYPSSGKLSTIFASSPWLAGFDDAGNLKMAAEQYPNPSEFDFTVGPLTNIGLPYYSSCEYFDKAWSIYVEDINAHLDDYYADFKIDDTIPSIFGWPGRGNKYFARFNGFGMPASDNQGLADFFDMNGDNFYDPDQGDHPAVYLSGYTIIPDQIMWMVFNDVDTINHTGNRPIRAEFQLTAFAFHCQDNAWLNNTIFSKYKIINRAVTPIDSLFFGLWTDYDLGCSEDDFMGCDSTRRTEFVYNADYVDGDVGADCTTGSETYALNPPVQSMTWLSHPMHSFISFNRMNAMAFDAYHHLNGLWGDGTPMRPDGDGYHQDTSLKATKFHYHGDPRDPNSWAANNVLIPGKDQRSVSSVSLGRLDPGEIRQVYTAHMFHHDPEADHLGQITHMYNNVDSLLAMEWFQHEHICTPFPLCTDDDCVWPGDFDKNGIVDHRDYLMWGVFNSHTGAVRDGQISWRGHPGEDWSDAFQGINTKHGDADGDGQVDIFDIDVHTLNLNQKNRFYTDEALYPTGSEILMSTNGSIDNQGRIRNFLVFSGQDLENVLGITFEVEFDTSLFQRTFLIPGWPESDSRLIFSPHDIYSYYNTSFVQTNNTGIFINSGFTLLRGVGTAFQLKPGKQMPDSTVIRLRNLKAIDPEGNDLYIGSEPLVVYRQGFVGLADLTYYSTQVYPNPSGDFIYVETEQTTEAQIYSIHGNLIRHLTFDEVLKPIDVSNMPPGIYILRILATGESIKIVFQ